MVQRNEREMIHGVFELARPRWRRSWCPRTDVFGVDVATPADRLLPAVRANLHHRVPVYEGSLDHVVGILQVKDLLPYYAGLPPDFDLRAHLTAPYFVPQSKRADALLREFKAKKLRTAIVVDEYGGTAGLVTLEDLLEEVVGEIRDEFEAEERLAQPVDERDLAGGRQDGDRRLQRVSRASRSPTSTSIRSAGWVLDLFGRVPHRGESVEAAGGVRVTVETMHRTRILQVLVRLPAPAATRPDGPAGPRPGRRRPPTP